MARIDKKPAKVSAGRMGKSALAALNKKAYGTEITYDHPMSHTEVSTAFNWYTLNVVDYKKAKNFLTDYLTSINRFEDVDNIKRIHESRIFGFGSSACWIARMLLIEETFEDEDYYINLFESQLTKIKSVDQEFRDVEESFKTKKPFRLPSLKRSPQELKFDRYLEILNEAFNAFDPLPKKRMNNAIDIIKILKDDEVQPEHVKDMMVEIEEFIKDCDRLLNSDTSELDEIERKSFGQLKKSRTLAEKILFDCRAFLSDTKKSKQTKKSSNDIDEPKVRKARRKKPVSAEKLISRLKYQKEDPDTKMESISPIKILGANELWIYNSKYTLLTLYRARNDQGFSVKGTTILNYDEEKSISKKIGRQTKERLDGIMLSGKVALKKYMDTLNGSGYKPNGRINENTILLRVL